MFLPNLLFLLLFGLITLRFFRELIFQILNFLVQFSVHVLQVNRVRLANVRQGKRIMDPRGRFHTCFLLSLYSVCHRAIQYNTGSNTGSIRDGPYWTRKNSLELIELSSINKVSLI